MCLRVKLKNKEKRKWVLCKLMNEVKRIVGKGQACLFKKMAIGKSA